MKLNTEFEVEVKRTNRRKTASLKVHEGHVQVIVPKLLTDQEIETLVLKKTKWIRDKLRIQRLAPSYKPKEFVSGESFSYLGKNYRLKILSGKKGEVKLRDGRFFVTVKTKGKNSRALLEDWFREKALQKLTEKTIRHAEQIGVNPKKISIREYKSRWGSCTAKGTISFNWKIMMAPNSIIDYVVIHELCHLKHHDHSPKYWKALESKLPDYREKKEWLKKHSKLLEW